MQAGACLEPWRNLTLAAGSLVGTWGDSLTILGLPSAWAFLSMSASRYRKNFSASIAWVLLSCFWTERVPLDQLWDASNSSRKVLLAGRQPKDAKRYRRISIKQALQVRR